MSRDERQRIARDTYDVAIIGGGVIGTFIARELSRYRLRTVLLEAENDVAMGATKANSGIVHGGYAESPESLRGKLCYPGRSEFPRLEQELHFGFRVTGSLVLCLERAGMPRLEALLEQGRRNGVPDLSLLSREEVLGIEPRVNREVVGALYCSGAGVASPYELAIALAENAVANGVEIRLNSRVERIESGEEVFALTVAVRSDAGTDTVERTVFARYAVNAAGVYADRIARMIGDDGFTIYPRKGQYILFARGTGGIVKNVLFQMPTRKGKGVLVTPTYHGNLMIGPDAQDSTDPSDTGTDLTGIRAILERARLTVDEIDLTKFLRTFSGVRAVSSTGDFVIAPSRPYRRFIHAAGIQSPGLTASPAIARMVIELLAEQGLPVGEAARPEHLNPGFTPYRKPIIRPKAMTMKEAVLRTGLPVGDPDRIVCRCEQVTEGEIVDALSRSIPVTSTDGVKRRTRAGMGWCQGSFCRPRVAELLKVHLGIDVPPVQDIEHSGVNRVEKEDLLEGL